nr:MAG: internal scaffolding protein [Microviridae sp.]
MPFDIKQMLEIAARSSDLGLVVSDGEDMTRQEFKDECDVNHILRQHGYQVRPVVYGVHDFDSDLTAQMQSRSVFQLWYDSAPSDVREAYPDLGSFLAAFGSGAFKTGLAGVEVPSTPDSPAPSQPEAGAAG